jgi:hypothetical protein
MTIKKIGWTCFSIHLGEGKKKKKRKKKENGKYGKSGMKRK